MKALQVVVERYVVGQFLGAGGMGIVYGADDLVEQDRVALKIARARFRRDPVVLRHFQREAIVGGRLAHPSVVSVRDAGALPDGTPFVVMELVSGRSLKALLDIDREWSLRRIDGVLSQLLSGLQALHDEGFVHADVKTDNVLVTDGDVATLIDLGLAHTPSDRRRCDTAVSGTPEYMAPEVIEGHGVVAGSDLYSAGIILYEMLTGTTPFAGGTSSEILRRHLEDPIVPPSLRCPDLDISPALDDVTMRALARDPADRFASAREFADALARTVDACEERQRVLRPMFSTDARTLECKPPRAPATTWSTRQARAALGRCVRDGDIDAIATATLELVDLLVAQHRLYEASCTLETTITMITHDGNTPAPLWRLLLVLAGVYDGLGAPVRARSTARAALDHATRLGSATGTFRVRALLERFSGRVAARAR